MDYATAWAPFDARFAARPDFSERYAPALQLDAGCLVIDLADVFEERGARFAAGEAAISAAALRAFVWLAGDEDLVALDWQHQSYRWSPAAQALSDSECLVPVFPNGDYYAHMPGDLRWGTFGHPWQQTITIWGDELVRTLGAELLTWLPRHPQSMA